MKPEATEKVQTRKEASSSDEQGKFEEMNAKALAIITLHVETFHLKTAGAASSAKDLWQHFAATYESRSIARQYQLRQQLLTMKMERGERVTRFLERLKSLWSDLLATGHDMKETELCWSALMGLPHQFDVIRTILMSTAGDLSLDTMLPQLLQVEQQNAVELAEEVIPIYGVRGVQRQSRKCYICGSTEHLRAQCSRRDRQNKVRALGAGSTVIKCFYCGKAGHTEISCHARHERNAAGEIIPMF